MDCFPKLTQKAKFFENKKLYAVLAEYPITKGHVVIVWKKHVKDLGRLNEANYDYLMDAVDRVRNAMMKVLRVKKVYLIYMDETEHVHWHLVPRYNEKGFNVFYHKPKKLQDTKLARELGKELH